MTEEELRALVRAAIASHAGDPQGNVSVVPGQAVRVHSSHALFAIAAGAEIDGPCIVEPAVMCNHCGYCKSYGH
jgi:hypothetical protein